jgi:putative restriction endonuclease
VIRNTAVALQVKRAHGYVCQVCRARLATPRGDYAEAAHIRPLGAPHDGPDVAENVLCLCPNHHVMFDYGAFTLGDDLRASDTGAELRVVRGHAVDLQFLRYHRDHYG